MSASSCSRLESLQMRKAAAISKPDRGTAVRACQDLADFYYAKDMSKEERDEYVDLLKCADGDRTLEAQAHRRIAEISIDLGETETSLASAAKYLKLSKRDGKERQRALVTIGRAHHVRGLELLDDGEADEAEETLQKAADFFDDADEAVDDLTDGTSALEKAEMRATSRYNAFQVCKARGGDRADLRDKLTRLNQAVSKHSLPLWQLKCVLELADLTLKNGETDVETERAQRLLREAEHHLKALRSSGEAEQELGSFYVSSAKVQLRKRNFKEAHSLLNQARKRHRSLADDAPFANALRGVRKLVKAAGRLERSGDEDSGRQRLLERLGDVAACLGLRAIAAKYYVASLESPEGRALPEAEKAKLHYSAGCCYFEGKDYAAALSSFRAELEVTRRLNPADAVETWGKVAATLEAMGQPFERVERELREALEFTRKKKLPGEEARLMQFLCKLQDENGFKMESLESKRRVGEIVSSHGLEEVTPFDFAEAEGEFSSESEPEEEGAGNSSEPSCSRQTRGIKLKRNKKGETELHLACQKEGKSDAVRALLAAGHPADVEDNFCFTPLLEACNFGFLDYVRILVEAGADVNKVGGREGERISALIDACTSGHLDVVGFLLDRGAIVHHQDKDGWLALNHLEAYLGSNKGDMRETEVAEAEGLIRRMREALDRREKSGQSVYVIPKKDSNSVLMVEGQENSLGVEIEDDLGITDTKKSRSRRRTEDAWEGDRRGSPPRRRPVSKRRRVGSSETGTLPRAAAQYRDVMSSLKGAATSADEDDSDAIGAIPAYMHDDDDRENRAPPSRQPSKKNKLARNRSFVRPADDDLPDVLPPVADDTVTEVPEMMELAEPMEEGPVETPQRTLTLEGGGRSLSSAKFTVIVEGKRMVIPLDLASDNSVGRLAEIAAERYSAGEGAGGARPVLKLLTRDGAELHEADAATDVLVGESELVAAVTRWHLPRVEERYARACAEAGTSRVTAVEGRLAECEATGRLEFSLALGPKLAEPAFRSVRFLTELTGIFVSGNKLGDAGIRVLCEGLNTLPNLTELDLSLNGLTYRSVESLLKAAQKRAPTSREDEEEMTALRNLRSLNLSFNYLGDESAPKLDSLVSALSLNRLELVSCGLTGNVARSWEAKVDSLDMNFNDLTLTEEKASSAFTM